MSSATLDALTPVEIRRQEKESVVIVWADGHRSRFPNRYLREHCPCAACRETAEPKRSLPVRGASDLYPVGIGVVGRYALHFEWSDRHDTGIYRYETLRALCPCEACTTSGRNQA